MKHLFPPLPDSKPTETQRLFAQHFFPSLRGWWAIFTRLAMAEADAVSVAASAERNGTRIEDELIAREHASDMAVAKAIGREFNLPVMEDIDPASLILPNHHALALLSARSMHLLAKIQEGTRVGFLLAGSGLRDAARRASDLPAAACFKLTTVRSLRQALLGRVSGTIAHAAAYDLSTKRPAWSARTTLSGPQGFLLGSLCVALPMVSAQNPGMALNALHIFLTGFFMMCVGLRFYALASSPQSVRADVGPAFGSELPHYSVLVAVYREADVIPPLISALRRLDWPASKLDIKLVCEADDRETIDAIRASHPPPNMEIIEVPNVGPRTKPKALNYALQLCRGEFIVLYDAEDVPHPRQLLEAWQTFQRSGPDVACLQAPLEVTNGDASLIANLFAFEYLALFRGLLPWLSSKELLLPLGGTSNHFRRDALEAVGRWDPFNVTEDADLGVRLTRQGYRTQTITLPTFEAGPETLKVWLPQRTRWFKGWVQTYLVHMRNPVELYRELGPRSFLIAQILVGGMVLSALAHPLFIGTLVIVLLQLATGSALATYHSWWLALDTINIAGGYVSFWLLGFRAMEHRSRREILRIACFTPVYWLMMSVAAWRAVFQLFTRPHLWEKTPHGPQAKRSGLPEMPDAARRHWFRKAGPSPMIFGSALPTASRSLSV